MDKLIKTRSSVTYDDNNVIRKSNSNEVQVELSNEIVLSYECYKNTVFIGEPCTFYATIYNPNLAPLVDVKVYFNLDENLPYVNSSLIINNRHYRINDFYKGIYLGNLSSLQMYKISFTCKATYPYRNRNSFSQMIVSYGYYYENSVINSDQLSNLVTVKIFG
jgi:hypothetical protein